MMMMKTTISDRTTMTDLTGPTFNAKKTAAATTTIIEVDDGNGESSRKIK